MTSRLLDPAKKAYVWTWLPGAATPVVAGRIDLVDGIHHFIYGQSYLKRSNDSRQGTASLFAPELPLRQGRITPNAPLTIAGCLRDAAPDSWGRRVILNRNTGRTRQAIDIDSLDELNYMLLSGSDRIGALDFQESETRYVAREAQPASLDELAEAAKRLESGLPLSRELEEALNHGTSIGGARPKAQLVDGGRKLIAKFSASSDTHNVVKAEFIAMRLAMLAGIDTARVELVTAGGKDVLLVERFDRIPCVRDSTVEGTAGGGWARKAMVSALTMLGLGEFEAHYGSYEDLAGILRRQGTAPVEMPRELFRRMVFNILVGNTDDHARNHAAFWDGQQLTLTPAYDIDPRPRWGREANQALRVRGESRQSRVALAIEAANKFGLTTREAEDIVFHQVAVIHKHFAVLSEEAGQSEVDRQQLANRAILNAYAFEGASAQIAALDRPL
jgi:serine/threonine-protein kinase HipA